MHRNHRPSTVCRVVAPARLHLGFLDLHGGLGRRFGGVGISLKSPVTELRLSQAPELEVSGPGCAKVLELVARFDRSYGVETRAQIETLRVIPEHRGLGSGTQLALAAGHALNWLHGLGLSSREMAQHLGRGRRSGIGVGAFDGGGMVADGGKSDGADSGGLPPPLIIQLPFPEEWRIVLIFDEGEAEGLHGRNEEVAFSELPVFSAKCAGFLSRIVMMKMLPALVERDGSSFADAIGEFQALVGSYFSPAQGGGFRSPGIRKILDYLNENDIKGTGQSSWGPTAFVIADDRDGAENLKTRIEEFVANDAFFNSLRIRLLITAGNNRGGEIHAGPAPT